MDLDGLKRRANERTGSPDGPTGPTDDSPTGGPGEAIERLCYAGESVVDAVPISGGTVGVTSHRVLALTPGENGPNLRAIDRPNVASIELSAGGDAAHGARALRYGVYALALFGASFVVDFGGVSDVDTPSGAAAGAGQVVQLAMTMVGLLELVDDVLRYAGLAVLVVALLFAALYGYSRDSYLAVDVAGDDAVRVPATAAESAAADRLRVALDEASTDVEGDATTDAADTVSADPGEAASVDPVDIDSTDAFEFE